MDKGNKSRWQAFGGGGWREMMFVYYFGKFFGVCGAFFGGRISERGQLGFWAPVACPGRSGPIVHIVCQLSLGDLQPLDVGIPVVLLFPALLNILVFMFIHFAIGANTVQNCSMTAILRPFFVSNTIFIHFFFFISFESEHKIDTTSLYVNSLQRSLNSSYKVTSFITSWKALLSKGQLRTMFGQANILRKRCD